MTVVHVGTVKGDHGLHLSFDSLSCSFYAETLQIETISNEPVYPNKVLAYRQAFLSLVNYKSRVVNKRPYQSRVQVEICVQLDFVCQYNTQVQITPSGCKPMFTHRPKSPHAY